MGELTIRNMTGDDLTVVRTLDRHAFRDLRERLTGTDVVMPLREPEHFLHWHRTDPAGAFVAERDGEITGFIFNHARGVRGWIGPLAVRPGLQRGGVGKSLMVAGLDYLTAAGCRSIGLDTFPENNVSVSLYLKLGFRIEGSVSNVVGHVADGEPALPDDVKTRPLEPADLDAYAAEVFLRTRFRRAEDLRFILGWSACAGVVVTDAANAVLGYAVMHPKRGAGSVGLLLSLNPARRTDVLRAVVHAAQRHFGAGEEISFTVHGRSVELIQNLFDLGFQVRRTMIRMERGFCSESYGCEPLCSEKG